MANQVSARLKGDDYQHLLAWLYVLCLKLPDKHVQSVRIEDSSAYSMDDVTLRHQPGARQKDLFLQVKYHVDQRNQYSTDFFLDPQKQTKSLLQKFWDSWVAIQADNPASPIELRLVSNWTWDSKDKFAACIDGETNGLKDEFFNASTKSAIGKIRARWKAHLGVSSDQEFEQFGRSITLRVGYDCGDELKERVKERMDYLGLKSGETEILICVGIVREWVKSGRQDVVQSTLDSVIDKHGLKKPAKELPEATIHLMTIKNQKFEVQPDHVLDWRSYFIQEGAVAGHQLHDPSDWNGKLLPELYGLENEINDAVGSCVIKARGKSRLSAWIAFGHAFSSVAKYNLEVEQGTEMWNSNVSPSQDFAIEPASADSGHSITFNAGAADTVAVSISVSGDIYEEVCEYLEDEKSAYALLGIRPERELGFTCLRNESDAITLALAVKQLAKKFVQLHKAKRLLIFYAGPTAAACFIGHWLNAVCKEVQVMEHQNPSYAPSFLLK